MQDEKDSQTNLLKHEIRLSDLKSQVLAQRLKGGVGKRKQDKIEPRTHGADFPLSSEQRLIWLHASQQPDVAIYNEPFTIYRYGGFDLLVLAKSLEAVVERHEILRTSFTADGRPIVRRSCPIELPFIDLTDFNSGSKEEEALRIATREARTPISLESGPLFRSHVVRLNSKEDRLYLVFHHIIIDAVSISRIFLPELVAIYTSLKGGEAVLLPDPLLQYGDYAIWRESHANPVALKRSLHHWKDQFSGELPVLSVPSDRSEPSAPSHGGSMECFVLPSELTRNLRQLGESQGVTLYTILLTAYKVLLFRYSGQQDLIVGSASDSRRRTELSNVMGCFVDTFALRTRPNADLSFSQYLKLTQSAVLEALSAAEVPFDIVVRELNPKRATNRHPIFQVFFSMRPATPLLPDGWGLEQMDVTVGASKFILYLELCERQDSIEGRFFYSTDLWDTSTIQRMVGHWLTLLQSSCHDPQTNLGQLPMLTPEEFSSALSIGGWNDTAVRYPDLTVLSLIERQVRRAPNKTAATFQRKHWTYEQLDARSETLARRLAGAGVAPGSVVCLYLNRSLDLLAGLIAILKVGAAYLPIDIHSPADSIQRVLMDAQPSAILTQIDLALCLPTARIQVVLTDQKDGPIEHVERDIEQMGKNRNAQVGLDDLAYVMYTSGTTGEPKGVEVSHRNLVNFLNSMQQSPGCQPEDVLLAITPISFDIAALEMFLPLITGGSLVIATREESRDPNLLADVIRVSQCTILQATPATWRTLLLSGWNDGRQRNDAGILKPMKLLCGGETLPRKLANDLLATDGELWNMYGPTETTVWSLIDRVSAGDGPVSVGNPIANTTAFIADSNFQLLPVGVPGELWIGGTGVARGYRGREKQTRERFVRLDISPEQRFYRTGDIAVRRENGKIEIQGRADHQVKVRGHRIELEAVDAAILAHPDVVTCAARVWPEANGNMRLSAYITVRDSHFDDFNGIRSFLNRSVPEYMIPSDFTVLEEIPLTAHGKVDRNRLPPPERVEKLQDKTELLNLTEARLSKIWANLLGFGGFRVHDNFFELGGHSLLVAAMQFSIKAEFGRSVTMADLFFNPTIGQQARLLDRTPESSDALPHGVYALQPQGSLSSLFWVHDLNGKLARVMGSDRPFFSLELTTEDIALLGQAPDLQSIAARHVSKILSTQDRGPYTVGGLCAWGILSYEIASQLKSLGHEVPLVVLLDAPNPQYVTSFDFLEHHFRFLKYLLARSARIGPRTSLSKIGLRLRRVLRAWRRVPVLPKTEMKISQETVEGAALRYKPKEFSGDVLLILATDRPPHLDFLTGWQAVVRTKLHDRYVNAHHQDLLSGQNADQVARHIQSFLNEKFTASALG